MDWEIYDGQMQRGPMPEAGVHDAIRNGLPRNAYVRQAGASEWTPVEAHPLFAGALHQRGPAGDWRPPPPPPPAYVGAAQPTVPAVSGPSPTTPYAVSGPFAGQAARRELGVAAVALLGLVLVLLGGLLNLKWVCGLCKTPIAGRSVNVCPSCHASFT